MGRDHTSSSMEGLSLREVYKGSPTLTGLLPSLCHFEAQLVSNGQEGKIMQDLPTRLSYVRGR